MTEVDDSILKFAWFYDNSALYHLIFVFLFVRSLNNRLISNITYCYATERREREVVGRGGRQRERERERERVVDENAVSLFGQMKRVISFSMCKSVVTCLLYISNTLVISNCKKIITF